MTEIHDEVVDDFLEHFGVKGMKWGVRNKKDTSTKSEKPKKLTRKEVKAERDDFYQKKATRMLTKAQQDPESLILVKDLTAYPTVVTGKEFVSYLSKGGFIDIRYSDIYAVKERPDGPYQLQAPERYVRSDKKKKR